MTDPLDITEPAILPPPEAWKHPIETAPDPDPLSWADMIDQEIAKEELPQHWQGETP